MAGGKYYFESSDLYIYIFVDGQLVTYCDHAITSDDVIIGHCI